MSIGPDSPMADALQASGYNTILSVARRRIILALTTDLFFFNFN